MNQEVQQDIFMKNPAIQESKKTILLVDDEDLVIDVGKAMLECLGHKVIVANSGEIAVDIVSKIGDVIDLILLDLSMPGMDGITTFDIIHKNCPKIPVLLSSGYSLEGDGDELLQKGCYGFIRKPVNIHELSQKIDLAFRLDVASSQEEYIPS